MTRTEALSRQPSLTRFDGVTGKGEGGVSRAAPLSRQGSAGSPESSGGSFMALLRNMAQREPHPLDKSEILGSADAGGVRVRLKHYFSRQKAGEHVHG